VDIAPEDMVDDIQIRLSRSSIWKKMLLGSIFGTIGLFIVLIIRILPIPENVVGMIGGIGLLIGIAGVCMSPFQFFKDIKRKTAYLVYDIVPSKEQIIQNFYDACLKLNKSEKLWNITGTDRHGDTKRNAGATATLSREIIEIYNEPIKRIKTNILIPSISIKNQAFCFFPDYILSVNSGKIHLVSYNDLEIIMSISQFREMESIPSDSEKIGSTWENVNKDGSPDRRFNDNRIIPILKYGNIKITNNVGFDLEILVSNATGGKSFVKAFLTYQSEISCKRF
jgi:hypothetical protein